MTRSPFGYPLGRSLDGDASGVSELQTDVMRFMAILALCLVAIFALVQAIPLAPVADKTPVDSPAPVDSFAPAAELVVVRPEPKRARPPQAPPVLQHAPADSPGVPAAARDEEGFTLRFEDDAALTRLVARNEVGLYAISPGNAYRMNIDRGQLSFWPASVPKRFHEMDEMTVPPTVIDAFRHSSAPGGTQLKWGVTIPSATSRQIDRYLHEAKGGALIIDGGGNLRLEH